MDWQPISTAPKDGTWIVARGGTVGGANPTAPNGMPPAAVVCWEYSWWGVIEVDGGLGLTYDNPTEWAMLS